MENCERIRMEWVENTSTGELELKCTNKNCKLYDHCGRNNYKAVADCKGCFAVLMPACDKQIPCCMCMTECAMPAYPAREELFNHNKINMFHLNQKPSQTDMLSEDWMIVE